MDLSDRWFRAELRGLITLIFTPLSMQQPTRDKTTIDDVADAADVSPATVSRVVNQTGTTADPTRERVLAVIEELKYRPNRTAKSLAHGDSFTIAVAVPTFTTPFHTELLKGVRSRLKGGDTDVLLCDLRWDALTRSFKDFLSRGEMDGLLAVGLPSDAEIAEEIEAMAGPVVLLGREWETFDSFYWDEAAGARLATEHLIGRGHERIAMITTHHQSELGDARVCGYQEALRSAGISPREEWVAGGTTEKHDGFSEEAGQEAMQTLLDRGVAPTGVFASSDVQAIGAWQTLRENGHRVPEDVALVGYDDIKVSRFLGLTSISQKMQRIGEAATDLLCRRLSGSGPSEGFSELVVPELVPRESSDIVL